MLKLISCAVAGETTFLTAKCDHDKNCRTHVFAKDPKGWHERHRDALLAKTYWNTIEADIILAQLEDLLVQAESEYLKEKK